MSFRTFCISQSEKKDLAIKIKDSLLFLGIFYVLITFKSLFCDKGRKCFIEIAKLKMLECILYVRSELHPVSELCVWEIHGISQVFN